MILSILYNPLIPITIIVSFLTAYLYKFIWRKYFNSKLVPKGYGVSLIIFIFIISYLFDKNNTFFLAFIFIVLLSFIYWFDDLYSLSAKFRILLQFFSGSILYYINFYNHNIGIIELIFFFFLFGLCNLLLTNISNFYDGLDLNLSIFIIINSIILSYIFNENYFILLLISIIVIHVLTFSFFNYKKNNLFYGDSGCFIFASILTLFIMTAYFQNNSKIYYFLIGISLPLIDVIYVLAYRIFKRESLLSRNHYHLYQILGKKYNNKTYLLIQLINALLIIFSLYLINYFFYTNFYIIIFISLFITIIFYSFVKIIINENRV